MPSTMADPQNPMAPTSQAASSNILRRQTHISIETLYGEPIHADPSLFSLFPPLAQTAVATALLKAVNASLEIVTIDDKIPLPRSSPRS